MKTPFAHLFAMLLLACACRAEDAVALLNPKDYSDLHILALNPKDPKWADSIHRLAKGGDGFTLERLRGLEGQKLAPNQAELLTAALSSIRKRVAQEDPQTFAKMIQLRLERAAWADLSCNPLEGTLVPWTLSLIQKQADKPEVTARLKQIESHYVQAVELTTLFSTMRERVPSYARRILAAAAKSPGESHK